MDISRVFTNRSEGILNFFQQPGIGYYIPFYQREYSWDTENIDQLMEDICSGVRDIVDGASDPIHFMGTLILVTDSNPIVNIKPLDPRALPIRVDNVIDGQQRISTIAIVACQLYKKLYLIEKTLPTIQDFDGLREAINTYLDRLIDVFSLDLRRGTPNRKPLIIRASIDQWTFDGKDDNYKSEISSYLAAFIRSIHTKSNLPEGANNSLIGKNIKRINQFLKTIEEAHESKDTDFPPASDILRKFSEVDLWTYPRPDLVSRVENRGNPMSSSEEKQICSLIQLFAFCHYLLQCCCFTIIQPISDVRAFDMFQSLNATGTPLTAFETFKPLVVNHVESSGSSFKSSNSEKYLESADRLLSSRKSASSKNKLTNEFLTLLALVHDGSKLSKQFSVQRRWLNEGYESCSSAQSKEEFINQIGNLATYWDNIVNFNPLTTPFIGGTDNIPERDRGLGTVCISYLQKANHRMANTVLSRFYARVIRSEQNADKEFILASKAIAAFFTLWRSALSTSGLDEVYRKLLREHISWEKGDAELTTQFLKKYLNDVLAGKNIRTKSDWLNKAKDYLRYDESATICRFVLFIVSEDTIPDPSIPGLMKLGNPGSTPSYLTAQRWISDELKSIEHIAPQKPEYRSSWEPLLYENDNYQRIGNLTLLPTPINSSLSNKGWIEKFIYYQHLAETDPAKLIQLQSEAQSYGVVLNPHTIDLLKNTPTKQHLAPIVQLGATPVWNKNFVEQRSERICDILWERLDQWIN
jgi:hypothetical protein